MRISYMSGVLVSFGVLAGVLLAGCSSRKPYPESMLRSPFLEEWAPLPAGVATNLPSADGSTNAVPPGTTAPDADSRTTKLELSTVDKKALPRQIIEDLNLPADTSVATVLRALAKVGNVNIVISPKVDGVISFTFKNIPWDQALAGVLTTTGLTYTWDGDILRVMTIDDMKRELEVAKVMQEREALRDSLSKIEPLTLHVIRIKYMSAKKIAQTIKDMLGTASSSQGTQAGRVMVSLNEENNSLIVQATQKEADKIIVLVSELDHPKLQVRIEARIVEANSTTARQLGIQWGGSYMTTDAGKIYTAGSGVGREWAANFPATFDASANGFALGLSSEAFGGAELLNIQLSALQEDGKAKILSSPSITTLDNETAAIESGQERAYRVTSGTGNALDTSLSWKKAVLKLEVTPHVIDPKLLRVEITANKDSFDESQQESNGEFPINTKNTKTTVLLKNGQTTVIGGLSEKTSSESESGIPFLKSLPLIGRLFKGTKEGASLDEVMIFITPSILKEPATMNLRSDL